MDQLSLFGNEQRKIRIYLDPQAGPAPWEQKPVVEVKIQMEPQPDRPWGSWPATLELWVSGVPARRVFTTCADMPGQLQTLLAERFTPPPVAEDVPVGVPEWLNV